MEAIIAILMFMHGELKEITPTPSISKCLAMKRIATRNTNESVQFQCAKVMAELDADGKVIKIGKIN